MAMLKLENTFKLLYLEIGILGERGVYACCVGCEVFRSWIRNEVHRKQASKKHIQMSLFFICSV